MYAGNQNNLNERVFRHPDSIKAGYLIENERPENKSVY